MSRIIWLWLCMVLCVFGEHRIIKMIPFGEQNLKIVFSGDISSLQWQSKSVSNNKSFVDFEANLTIARRNFIFKDNSTLQIAQNTPKLVRLVIATSPQSSYEIIKEKENLYIFIKPKEKLRASSADSRQTSRQYEQKQAAQQKKKESMNTENIKQKSNAKVGEKQAIISSIEKQEDLPKSSLENPSKSKKVVVDAGHGGKDCGTKSVEGVCEKMIVLEVAKLLANELKARGYAVYMTRNSDVYIDLRKRTEFANAKNADLFISVHANSMPKDSPKTPSGVETYFLSPARSERAEQVAKAENQGDIETMSHFATKSFLNTISAFHLVASHKLAIEIQSGILSQVRQKHDTHDGAVREGPFWVLAGALMPSVLIEIGYASHRDEGKLIATKEYQKLLAKGIANGVDGYFLRNY